MYTYLLFINCAYIMCTLFNTLHTADEDDKELQPPVKKMPEKGRGIKLL